MTPRNVVFAQLPSLDLLRGFVAVGRRMSITLAAKDLHLTQSAVSRQVQALEQSLGVRLLTRGYRAVAFTSEGERLFRAADHALRQLEDAASAISGTRERPPVAITASIGVTALWLLPRLGRLQRTRPDLDVRVAANNRRLDLRTEAVDLAIRYSAESAAPRGSIRLFGEHLVAVAHPSLGVRTLDTAATIAGQVLLEYDDPKTPWLQWTSCLIAMGLKSEPKRLIRYNQYDQVVQAAIAGQGIALGRRALIASILAERQLIEIATPSLATAQDYAYWLISADADPRDDVRAVMQWIEEEARRTEVEPPLPRLRRLRRR